MLAMLWALCLAAFIGRVFLSAHRFNVMSTRDVDPEDRELFFVLSNPEVVDRDVRRAIGEDLDAPSPSGASHAAGSPRPYAPTPAVASPSVFQARVDEHIRILRSATASPHAPSRPVTPVASPVASAVASRIASPVAPVDDAHASSDHDSRSRRRRRRRDRDRDDSDDAPPAPPAGGETLRLEKQATLQDLERLRLAGAHLSRQFVLSDDLEDMRFELEKHAAASDERKKVTMMKSFVESGLRGVEFYNAELGPFVHLTGWSDEITSDMSQFDDPLARIYRKYWRRSTSSPEVDLAWIILSSMGLFHVKNKLSAALRARQPPRPPPPVAPSVEETAYGAFAAVSEAPPVRPPAPAATQRRMTVELS